ncbi:hypothetical protein EKO27_g10131 [Xylaria grammica]|uniref:Uncharacterized protein n=1 Tax=Xylaria grammica TaxID=363999 RepID=A0A439CS45_9PEZI|nr:hypothetical protein EKO27_g10131 [Xylaria grammica]
MYGFKSIATGIPAVLFSLVTYVHADVPHHTNLTSYQAGDLGQVPTQTFFSSPVKAPIYQVNKLDTDNIDDTRFLFLTGGYDGYGPSIVSSKDLSLVYADQGYNFAQAAHTATLYGEQVLVVYAGDAVRIYNKHYELLAARGVSRAEVEGFLRRCREERDGDGAVGKGARAELMECEGVENGNGPCADGRAFDVDAGGGAVDGHDVGTCGEASKRSPDADVGPPSLITPCDAAASIIAGFQGHGDVVHARRVLGCGDVTNCHVKNTRLFQLMDEAGCTS